MRDEEAGKITNFSLHDNDELELSVLRELWYIF